MAGANGSYIPGVKDEDFESLQVSDLVRMGTVEKFLATYKSLECSVCRRHFGYVHRKDPRIILCSAPCLYVASDKLKNTAYAHNNASVFYKPVEAAVVAEARLVPRGSGVSKISASTETEEMENGKRLSTPSVIHTECAKTLMASQESDPLENLKDMRKMNSIEPCYGLPTANDMTTGREDCPSGSGGEHIPSNGHQGTNGASVITPELNPVAAELARHSPKRVNCKSTSKVEDRVSNKKLLRPQPSKDLTKCFMKDLPYSPALKEGARVYVSFTMNAVTFILRAVEDEEKVQNLQAEIILHCEKSPPLTVAPAINQIICTLYDGTFYRGVVREVNEKDSEVVVDFIDYGDSSAVKMSDCRNISEEIMKKHPVSYGVPFECDMSVQCPPDLQPTDELSAILEEELCMHVRTEEDGKLRGSLGIPSKNHGTTWNQLIGNLILSDAKVPCSKEENAKATTAQDQGIAKQEAKPASKKESGSVQTKDQAVRGTTSTERANFYNIHLSPNMTDGAQVHINFAWDNRKLCISAKADDENFIQLQKEIERHVQTAPPMDRIPERDDIVLAPFRTGDELNYYRGLVTRVDGSLVHVRFIDYGDETVVENTKLRELNKAIRGHNIYGLLAKLAGVPSRVRPGSEIKGFNGVTSGKVEVVKRTMDYWKIILRLDDGTTLNDQMTSTLEKDKKSAWK